MIPDALTLEKLSVFFPTPDRKRLEVIRNVTVSIAQREFVTLLGPSGCGKSTLLKVAAGLREPTEGLVLVKGIAVRTPGASRGLVPQSLALFPWLTVQRNIRFGLDLKGQPADEADATVDRLLAMVGLSAYRDYYPAALSGGMQQRLAIARTLALDPDVLLMDEPFGSLDTQTRAIMQERLLDIWDATHKSIFFVTHDVDEAIFLSDRIFISSALPATIISHLRIELPRPRSFEVRLTTQFLDIKKSILQDLRAEALKAFR